MFSRLARIPLPRLLPLSALSRSFVQVPVEKKLKKLLEKELEHESKEYKTDESVGPFLNEQGFQLEEAEDRTEIRLKKTVNGTEILVTFNARGPEPEPQQEEGAPQEGAENQEGQSAVDFQVSFNTRGKGLIFECSTANSEININNIVCAQDIQKVDRISDFVNSHEEYRGPDFSSLEEELQKSLLDYLKTHGVDENLATFIENYSMDKEQRLYMDWLAKVKNFLS